MRKIKIGVDAREIQNGIVTGIGRSLANFIEYFIKNEKKHTLLLYSEKKIDLNLNGNIKQIYFGNLPTFFWDQVALPQALKTQKIDLFYSPYYKIPLLTKIPVVNQILDLMYLNFPVYFKALGPIDKLYYATFGKTFARKSISIITDSQHAKRDILNAWKINPEKIVVIPLGLSNRFKPFDDLYVLNKVKKRLNLPEKFILYLGNFKPHKNVKSLVKAYKVTSKKFPEYKLVLAGPIDKYGKEIMSLVKNEGLMSEVIFTDTIKEDHYPEALLSLADMFVFPTLYEGFGLPPLEAMACGTPVIASNLTSVPEVVGEAGILVDPLDINELSGAIAHLVENPEKKETYSKKGLERAQCFREKDTAGKLYNHIISLLKDI